MNLMVEFPVVSVECTPFILGWMGGSIRVKGFKCIPKRDRKARVYRVNAKRICSTPPQFPSRAGLSVKIELTYD